MYAVQKILNKIQTSKSIDFGELFNESLGVFKKVWVQGLLLQLFSIIVMLPFIIVFYVSYISFILELSANQSMDYTEFNETLFEGFGLYMVLAYLAIFVLSIASSLLYLGFYKIVKDMDHGNPFVMSDFFYFFKSRVLGKSIVVLLATTGISVLATLLCFFPIIYAVVPLMFILPVFAYNSHLSVSEIIKVSFALGNKKWGIIFLMLILNCVLFYVITILTCGLGALFVSCFLYLPQYIIYKNVVGFDRPESVAQTIV